jgi:protein translocase SEC61 complex gamma subunit
MWYNYIFNFKNYSNVYYSLVNLLSAVNMGVQSFLSQCARTLKLAVKPGRTELWLSIKISLLGIGAVGLIGFVIKLLSFAIGGATAATN